MVGVRMGPADWSPPKLVLNFSCQIIFLVPWRVPFFFYVNTFQHPGDQCLLGVVLTEPQEKGAFQVLCDDSYKSVAMSIYL